MDTLTTSFVFGVYNNIYVDQSYKLGQEEKTYRPIMLITYFFFILSILYVSVCDWRPHARFGGYGGGGGGAYTAYKQKSVKVTAKQSRGAEGAYKNGRSTSINHIAANSTTCPVINETTEHTDDKGEDVITETAFADRKDIYGFQPFLDPAYKFIFPVLLGTCLGATLCFVFVLSKQMQAACPMSRASLSLLIAIATADVLTTGFGLSELCYRFSKTIGNPGFLPFGCCKIKLVMELLIWIFHEASVWFTVILTAQRYVCVSRPFLARRCINLRYSLTCVLVVFLTILALRIYRFFDQFVVKINIEQIDVAATQIVESCDLRYASWVEDPVTYESLMLWLTIVLMQLLPSIIVVIFVCLIVNELVTKNTCLTSKTAKNQRVKISINVIFVALIVVGVEFSSAIFLSLCAWSLSTGNFVFSYETMKSTGVVFDIVLYVSYFVIFLLYILVSHETRNNIIFVLQNCLNTSTTQNALNPIGSKCSKDISQPIDYITENN